MRRRELLTGGTVAAISGLSGCASICPDEFTAPVALIPDPGAFGLQSSSPQELLIQRNVLGEREIRNQWVLYEPAEAGAVAPIGILSTPLVTCLGQDLNPVATQEFEQLLSNPDLGSRFVNIAIPGASETDWLTGPTAHETWAGTLFGQDVSVETYTGVGRDSEDTLYAIFVGLTRHTADSEAVLVGVGSSKSLPADATPSEISVVPDAFTPSEVDDIKTLLLSVLPVIRKEGQARQATATPQPGTGYGLGGYGLGGYGGVSA